MSIPEGIITGLKLFYDIFKDLHKSESEKFEKEWKEDEQTFLKAMQDRQSADPETQKKGNRALAVLFTKYSNSIL